ncbi:MAG: PLP-dependent aminotransferase family protein [Acholeplasmataceae bacterium]|nr:PLP-dependent aminotransferase family protein [Acholeplasmataceae bacterium]
MHKIKYLSIYNELKKTILDGTYPIQSKLPSKRILANFYNVSVMTVDNAYQQLIAEGYVISMERKGYYVNDLPEHRFFKQGTSILDEHVEDENNISDIQFPIRLTYFPHHIWAKLSRKVLSDDLNMMDFQVNPQGLIGLRVEIKKYLEIYRGIHASIDQIVIGSGSQAMMQLVIALVGRDYTFIMEEPGFPRLKNIIRLSGMKLLTIEQDDQGIIINKVTGLHPTVLHITPSHQYPTGKVMPVGRRIECLNWSILDEHRYIIEDDYDSEFRYQGQPIPAVQSLDKSSKVIYMNTFSKSLSPALKINYLVLPKTLMNAYHNIKSVMPCSVPIFEQKVLLEFMKEQHFERHLNKVKKIYRKKALYIIDKFKNEKLIKISGHETGLHMILTFDSKIEISALDLIFYQQSVHLQKLNYFYDNEPKEGRDYMFEYTSLDDDEIAKTVEIIIQALNEQKKSF